MNRIETEPTTNGQPAATEPGPALTPVKAQQTQTIHPTIRSRCWRTATEAILHDAPPPPPNWFQRICHRLLLGWRWESVVVVIVERQHQPPG